jgi:O-antigen ligase
MHLLLGISLVALPLWGFAELRIPLGVFTLDLFTLFIVLAAVLALLTQRKINFSLSLVDILVFCIFTIVLLTSLINISRENILIEIFRYSVNFIIYILGRIVFSASKGLFLKSSYLFFSIITIVVLSALIYLYVFVYGLGYISISFNPTDGVEGRNRLAFVLLIIGPIIYSSMIQHKQSNRIYFVVTLLAFFIYIASVLLTQSRGAWFSLILFLLYILTINFYKFTFKNDINLLLVKIKLKHLLTIIFLVIPTFGVILFNNFNLIEPIFLRAGRSFSESGADASTTTRLYFIEESFKIALENPSLGSGLGAVADTIGHQSHNDYFKIIAELGVFGLLCFIIIFLFLWYSNATDRVREKKLFHIYPLMSSVLLVSVYLLFRNTIDSSLFWILLSYAATVVSIKMKVNFKMKRV